MGNGHMGKAYTIRVRQREQHEHVVYRGDNKHRRRVARWGAWKTWRVARDAVQAVAMVVEVRSSNRLSDVAVFFDGKRLTNEQLDARAAQMATGDKP